MTPLWDEYSIGERLLEILADQPVETTYGVGRPFMTTYQIVIEFERRFPQIADELGHTAGGEGNGPYALTNYFARWLPQMIRTRPALRSIEFRFLSSQHLAALEYCGNDRSMRATPHQAGFNNTMFRLRND